MCARNLYAWEWNPDQYQPQLISGPDLIMRDSLYARFNAPKLLQPNMQKSLKPHGDCVICEFMNTTQKLAFLALHLERYGYKISDASQYAHLVQTIESVEYIICLHKAGVTPLVVHNASKSVTSLITQLRLMKGFPAQFIPFLH